MFRTSMCSTPPFSARQTCGGEHGEALSVLDVGKHTDCSNSHVLRLWHGWSLLRKQTWLVCCKILSVNQARQSTSNELPADSSFAASGLSARCFRVMCMAMAAWLARLSEPSADAVYASMTVTSSASPNPWHGGSIRMADQACHVSKSQWHAYECGSRTRSQQAGSWSSMRPAEAAAAACRSGMHGRGVISMRRHASSTMCHACLPLHAVHSECPQWCMLPALVPISSAAATAVLRTSSSRSAACMKAPSNRPAAAMHRAGTGVLLHAARAASSALSALHAAAERRAMCAASRAKAAREAPHAQVEVTQAS